MLSKDLPHEDGKDSAQTSRLQLVDISHVDPMLLQLIDLIEGLVFISVIHISGFFVATHFLLFFHR